MNISKKLSLLSLALATAIVGASSVGAQSFAGQEMSSMSTEDRESLMEARELAHNGEFEAAKEIMEGLGVKLPEFRNGGMEHKFENRPELTAEQKEILEQARELAESGDREGAKQMIEDAGIELPHRMHKAGDCPELTDEQKEVMEKARELAESGDREGAKQLIEDAGIKLPHRMHKMGDRPELTEEQKDLLKQARELAQSGEKEAAKQLIEDSGIEVPKMKKFRNNQGRNFGQRQGLLNGEGKKFGAFQN